MRDVLDRIMIGAACRWPLLILRRHEVVRLARLIEAARTVAWARDRARQANTAGQRAYANESYAETAAAVHGLCHVVGDRPAPPRNVGKDRR